MSLYVKETTPSTDTESIRVRSKSLSTAQESLENPKATDRIWWNPPPDFETGRRGVSDCWRCRWSTDWKMRGPASNTNHVTLNSDQSAVSPAGSIGLLCKWIVANNDLFILGNEVIVASRCSCYKPDFNCFRSIIIVVIIIFNRLFCLWFHASIYHHSSGLRLNHEMKLKLSPAVAIHHLIFPINHSGKEREYYFLPGGLRRPLRLKSDTLTS